MKILENIVRDINVIFLRILNRGTKHKDFSSCLCEGSTTVYKKTSDFVAQTILAIMNNTSLNIVY